MKIVIDTNVVVSAMFFGGKPRELIELLVKHAFDAYASSDIVTEYPAIIHSRSHTELMRYTCRLL